MNERIEELMEQASAGACHDVETNTLIGTEIERFAELIAKETILEVWIQLFNHGIDLSENTLFLEAMKKTKEHSGVEE